MSNTQGRASQEVIEGQCVVAIDALGSIAAPAIVIRAAVHLLHVSVAYTLGTTGELYCKWLSIA